jgi:hypothetical protein
VIVQDAKGPAEVLERLGESAANVDPALLSDREAVEALALAQGRLGDPFALLGPHPGARGTVVRAYLPSASRRSIAAARCWRRCRSCRQVAFTLG